MTKITAIPRLGELLRVLITAGGYRGCLVECGLDKNLDDLAVEAEGRQSSMFDMLQKIEDACRKKLVSDCGPEWAQSFQQAWFGTRKAMQALARQVDFSPMPPEKGNELFVQQFAIPLLSGFMNLIITSRSGPDLASWWASPFQSWISFAASRTGITEKELQENLANAVEADPRTINRWLSGEPISNSKVSWPYAPKVKVTLGKPMAESEIHFLAGWLLVACAYQSLLPETRKAVARNFALRKQQPWTLEKAIATMNQDGFRLGDCSVRSEVASLLNEMRQLFLHKQPLHNKLKQFKKLIEQVPPALRASCQYVDDWFSAQHAAQLGDKETALRLYASAVSGAWWRAGTNQHPILKEALMYAVGVGDKNAANAYWDKTFMLGLNQEPKRPLDEQERRRIASAFEPCFQQKAKDRIPPPMELKCGFSLDRKHLKNPNQKIKHAEGRTRRTPLIEAILEGTLDDVKRLIEAGGDPNDFIPESGEGPLSYAMRRACDRKDTRIMEYLLGLDLSPETVNRSASTKRETPLKIAVEMANVSAVAQLIELGADVEAACGHLPSALCYAMSLFHGSLHRDDPTQLQAYFAGKTPADIQDAREGAILGMDLAARREHLRNPVNASSRDQQILKSILDYYTRPPEDHREVIRALLAGGANANRRYRVEAHSEEWTPTLFAAQVGDLAVFKMLVEHSGANRGDPDLTLIPPNSRERRDALWVAIAYKRHLIVSYLQTRKASHNF